MKELIIEEKARAYDYALAKARDMLSYKEVRREDIEYLFPELIESEDEKIRKELIDYHRSMAAGADDYMHEAWIAWLEKQKEYESTDFDYVWETTDCSQLTSALDKYSEDAIKKVCHAWYDKGIELERKNWLEKQGEQKPTSDTRYEVKVGGSLGVNGEPFDYEKATITQKDFAPKDKCAGCNNVKGCVDCVEGDQWAKITEESKFKVGDWVTDGYLHNKITDVLEDRYIVDTKFVKRSAILFNDESRYHLWTIQDAKEGDVLVNGSNIFIFHFINDTRLIGYCHINTDDGRFYDDTDKNECFCLIDAIVNPATKEQRDFLFQKMREAGYEWDAGSKKPKKIEQKPAELAEDEGYNIDELYAAVDILQKTLGEVVGYQTYNGMLAHQRAINAIKELYEQSM